MTVNAQADGVAWQGGQQTPPTERAASHMLALGGYRFSVDTAAYQAFSREFSFLWPTQQRVSNSAVAQFTGLGAFKRSLNGVIYPEYKGGLKQVDAMVAEAGRGQPLQLTSGTGDVMGFWCITSIRENATVFHRNGQARKLAFSLELLYYGDQYQEANGAV